MAFYRSKIKKSKSPGNLLFTALDTYLFCIIRFENLLHHDFEWVSFTLVDLRILELLVSFSVLVFIVSCVDSAAGLPGKYLFYLADASIPV